MAQGKSRGGATPRKSGSSLPGWVWLLTGLVAGFFLSFLLQLASIEPAPAPGTPDRKDRASADAPTTRFDFYTLLPEREVIVRREEAGRMEDDELPGRAEPDHQFILQAGSFGRHQDADRRRAQVLLLGLDARIETVDANGQTWHRVHVGPFDSRGPLDRARALLIEEGIDTLLLRRQRDA